MLARSYINHYWLKHFESTITYVLIKVRLKLPFTELSKLQILKNGAESSTFKPPSKPHHNLSYSVTQDLIQKVLTKVSFVVQTRDNRHLVSCI